MARYIDADKFQEKLMKIAAEDCAEGSYQCEFAGRVEYNVALMLQEFPTADVAEVRHCEKCKYYRSVYCDEEYLYTVCLKFDIDSKPKDYCAWFELEGKEDARESKARVLGKG